MVALHHALDNPIKMIDPDGMAPDSAGPNKLSDPVANPTIRATSEDRNKSRFVNNPNFVPRIDANTGEVRLHNGLDIVRGTLIKGFDFYQALGHPFARAIYVMFMVSKVHPFLDGNGRVARVMLNAELVKQHQTKIIIPSVYREDYILALRKLTRQGDPAAYIRMMGRAHELLANRITTKPST